MNYLLKYLIPVNKYVITERRVVVRRVRYRHILFELYRSKLLYESGVIEVLTKIELCNKIVDKIVGIQLSDSSGYPSLSRLDLF